MYIIYIYIFLRFLHFTYHIIQSPKENYFYSLFNENNEILKAPPKNRLRWVNLSFFVLILSSVLPEFPVACGGSGSRSQSLGYRALRAQTSPSR